MKKAVIAKILISSLSCLSLFLPSQADAQLLPQPWVSIGEKDGDVTYAVGVRALDFGVELGQGPDGSTGADILKFISLPVISPYVGVGWYSEDQGVAFSGGVQVGASDNVFIGGGYNSVRGVNGQLGIRF
ncbi:hypothetical protein VB620_00945 [Nodularia harveyana UHCC-0300]|uniref:Uncharacterized protein n=1 Tax=Nodularia harveyana UHCC-0300 TaxID=2974287 RepID=A0ABU5U8S6_9CYAN|nr:hypothetical protein [Nodularia harveyana]MEA5579904.1 hypothetical protein [Nodularia harveyana UHCC-0300]